MSHRCPVLILPGLGNSGPDHWQSHWERADSDCRRVLQDNWDTPDCRNWVLRLDEVLAHQAQPVVLAAHSSACAMVAHWAHDAAADRLKMVRGALLVAPTDPTGPHYPTGPVGFGPVPLEHLPFASIIVASDDDRYLSESVARHFATAWGSQFVWLRNAGHINAASGHGAWPEGRQLLDSLRLRD
ncbi:alpha/beta hydrolase [Tahibacter amnicola]